MIGILKDKNSYIKDMIGILKDKNFYIKDMN